MIKNYLFIKRTGTKGQGVFTKEAIAADTLIEEAPVIVMTTEDRAHIDKTLLHDYIFDWGKRKINVVWRWVVCQFTITVTKAIANILWILKKKLYR